MAGGPAPRRPSSGPLFRWAEALASPQHPVLWGVPPTMADADTRQPIQRLWRWLRRAKGGPIPQAVRDDLTGLLEGGPWDDSRMLLRVLAWGYAWHQVARRDPQLGARLAALLQSHGREEAVPDDPAAVLVHQWKNVELPLLVLSWHHDPGATASAVLAGWHAALEHWLDGEGIPHQSLMPWILPLLACWTRSFRLAQRLGPNWIPEDLAFQLRELLRFLLRWKDPDGTVATGDAPQRWGRPFLKAAAAVLGTALDRRIAGLAGRLPSGASSARLPAPSARGDWAGLAVLRADWSPRGPRWSCRFTPETMEGELCAGGMRLLSGVMDPTITASHRSLAPVSPWEEVCWHLDEEVAYLELECELAGGWRWQRQMVLARQDHLFFLADAILGEQPALLEYSLPLPIPPGIRFKLARETTEGFLYRGRQRRATVIPLFLPEWQVAMGPHGQWVDVSSQPAVVIQQQGRSLYVPLLVDLHRPRLQEALTWRHLTVGQDRARVRPDVAVGYRIQIGRQQWLLYRSLTAAVSRTVLGQNLRSDFLLGRFTPEGTVDPVIEIEEEEQERGAWTS